MRRWPILAAALLAATACRSVPVDLVPLAPDDPRPEALRSAWVESAGQRRALRGRAHLSVDGAGGEVQLRGKQILVLERPARLRVEIQGLLNQTVAVLVTDGERFELFQTQDRSYETGPVHAGLLWEQAYIALTPTEAIDLLLGAPAPDPSLVALAALGDGQGGVSLDLGDSEGELRRRLRFDASGHLRRIEVFEAGERAVWQADFDSYSLVNGMPFAHAITLDVTAGSTHAEISLRDVELNPALSPTLFQLRKAAEEGPGG